MGFTFYTVAELDSGVPQRRELREGLMWLCVRFFLLTNLLSPSSSEGHFSTLPTDKINDRAVNVLSVQVHQGR